MTHKQSKTQKRSTWILENLEEIKQAATPFDVNQSVHNARYNSSMSGPGWGHWAQAFKQLGLANLINPMPYWSGSASTPSTSINRGIAEYVNTNSPEEIR